jgi:glycogen operon protein
VINLREQQKRNLMASLLLSVGVPMISGGDELGRTQCGNNNAYCQDNATSWTCWSLMPEQRDFLQFTRRLVHFRRSQPTLTRRKYFQGRSIRGADVKDIYWLDPSGREMTDAAWNAPFVRSLGVLMVGDAIGDVDERGRFVSGDTLLILFNAHFESVPFVLPAGGDGHRWVRILDTIETHAPEARFAGGTKYPLQGRTVVLFTLEKHRRHRRASDHDVVEADERMALQVMH